MQPQPYNNHMINTWENSSDGYSNTSSLTSPCLKAFDIEVDMAREIVTTDPNARPKHFRNCFEEVIFVFTIMMATACTTFIQGVININTITIGRDLFMTPAQITWIAAAIGLASGSFMLLFGKTADLFGRKIQILSGLSFLTLISLLTAFSPSPLIFDIFCGLLGLGTAIIAPPAIGLLFTTYPEGKRRNYVTGALGAGNPIGFLIGSLSSGLSNKYEGGWRGSFYFLAGVFAVLGGMAVWTCPAIPRAGNARVLFGRFDYGGTVLVAVGMSFVAASLTQAPSLSWTSPHTLTLLILGLLLLALFAFWQTIHPYPLLSPSIWKNTNFTLCIICVGFGYMSFITNSFWLMLYMQDIQSLSPLTIAIRLLPQVFTGLIWSYLGQYLVGKWSGKVVMGIGGVGYVVGSVLVWFSKEGISYWKFMFPSLCITVIGADFQFIVANLYISTAMPTQSSLGAGVLQTAMRLSISVGLSITSAAYGSVASTIEGKEDHNLPYERAYLCSIIFAVLGLCTIPFMTIGKQGQTISPRSVEVEGSKRTSGSSILELKSSLRYQPLNASRMSDATTLSVHSTESRDQRWSLETEEARITSKRDGALLYEVCTNCGEERRNNFLVKDDGYRYLFWESALGPSQEIEDVPTSPWRKHHRHTWSTDRGFKGFEPMPAVAFKESNGVRMNGCVRTYGDGWI